MTAGAVGRATARAPRAATVLVVAVLSLGVVACGPADSPPAPRLGTLALANETDQGILPLTVEQLYIQPVGGTEPSPNLLREPVGPGGIVILGRFPEGQYDVVARIEGNIQWAQNGVILIANQPTTLRLRFD